MWDDTEFGDYDYNDVNSYGDLGGYDQVGMDGGSYSDASADFNGLDFSGMFGPQGQQFDYQASMPEGTFSLPQEQQFGFGGEGVGIPAQEQFAPQGGYNMGDISNTLAQLFNGQGISGKGALTGLGAILEGYQNRKKAQSVQNIVNQQQQRSDPFGAQRPFYQQQLRETVQNPYSSPMVQQQVAQLQKAQMIKDAAAGRRSNQATSNPALLAAQAQVAQKYMDSLMQPAGAGINPNAAGLEALLAGNNAGINGFISPALSAATKNAQYEQLVELLNKYKAQ